LQFNPYPESDSEAETLDNHEQVSLNSDQDDRVVGRSYDELPQPSLIRRRGAVREIIETLLLVISIYALVNLSTARFVVEGSSMEPNFHSDEFVIVSRLAYIVGDPERGDVIVFHFDEEQKRDFIKRIVGLPGETVEMIEGRVYVNGVLLDEPYIAEHCRPSQCSDDSWTLEDDQYFVLGDNRNSSQDSHDFGPIRRKQIIGRAWIRYWPVEVWQIIPHHDYDNIPEEPLPSPSPTPDHANQQDVGSEETIPPTPTEERRDIDSST